jgi:hypothetical protein
METRTLEDYEAELAWVLRTYNPGKAAVARLKERYPIDRQIAILRLVSAVQLSLEAARRRGGFHPPLN